jgi:nitrogen fixation/metabolism regulation signal transduction histidine kinase
MNQDDTRFTTSDLLGYPAANKFDLNQIVQKLSQLRPHEHHYRKIAVILDLATELPNTSADGSQIECVLLTLFARSRDAIIEAKRPHGTITLRTRLKAGRIQFSITDDSLPDASSGLFGTIFTRPLEEDVNLTTCAEIVQEQDGERSRPIHQVSRLHGQF